MTAMTTVTVQAPTSVADTLRRARALIEDPKHWIKGAYARMSKRSMVTVPATAPDAGAFCAVGALRCIDGEYEADAVRLLAEAIVGQKFAQFGLAEESVTTFNDDDDCRHRKVMQAFDKAIALAESGS